MVSVKRLLLRTAGLLVALGAGALALGIWLASSWYHSESADAARASAAFGEVRAQFAGVPPAFEIRGDRLVVARQQTGDVPQPPNAAHLLVWDPPSGTLARITLPFWISAVATEPLPLEALTGVADQGPGALMEAKRRGHELGIRLSDLERYGRTLILDGVTSDGRHVVMWSQ